MKKSKLLICALFVSLFVSSLPGTESFAAGDTGENAAASGLQDENQQRLEEVTAMDKDGSVYEIGESDGSLDETVEVDETGEVVTDDNAANGIATFSLEPEEKSASVLVVNFNTKGNAVTEYTRSDGTGGYTNGAYGADAAYLGTDQNGNIRFMQSGATGTVSADEVELTEYSKVADHVSYYSVSGGKLYHYISQNLNQGNASTINNGTAPDYLKEGIKYYSYDGHYFYDDYSVMSADYQNGANGASAVNAGNPFENFFQFFDMNQSTAYSADELESILNSAMKNAGVSPSQSKLAGTAGYFIKYQNTYGVNALLSLSIAINESGWGTSNIAHAKNNLFGLSAYDGSALTSANSFESVEECIRQFMDKWMSDGYLNTGNWKYYGGFLGSKGEGINVKYASDPYWGEKAAALAWNLDALGGSRDYLGLGSSENEAESEPEEPEVTDPPVTDKPEATDPPATDKPEVTEPPTDKPSDEEQQKPSDEEQQKPSDEEQQKPSDEEQQKPSDEEQQKPSDEEQQKPSEEDQQKPSDEEQQKPSDEEQQKPSDDTTDKPTENKPETDKTKEPKVIHEYGITIVGVDGTVNAAKIEPNTDKYTEYVSADPVKGKVVLGVYDITVNGTVEGKAQLTFAIPTEYNGKNVIILHYKDDGSYEKYAATVKDGQVTINVDSFSPFVIALDDAGSEGDGTVPTTGVTADPGSLAVIMVLAAALGVTALLKRRSYIR